MYKIIANIKNNLNSGQSMLEVIAALSVILLIISSVVVLSYTSVNNTTFVKNQNLASKISQDGMEFIRNLEHGNPTLFNTYNGLHCMDQSNNISATVPSTPADCSVINSSFRREVLFRYSPGNDCQPNDATEVTVSVFWSSSKCPAATNAFCHSAVAVSCFRGETVVGP